MPRKSISWLIDKTIKSIQANPEDDNQAVFLGEDGEVLFRVDFIDLFDENDMRFDCAG